MDALGFWGRKRVAVLSAFGPSFAGQLRRSGRQLRFGKQHSGFHGGSLILLLSSFAYLLYPHNHPPPGSTGTRLSQTREACCPGVSMSFPGWMTCSELSNLSFSFWGLRGKKKSHQFSAYRGATGVCAGQEPCPRCDTQKGLLIYLSLSISARASRYHMEWRLNGGD